MPLPCKKRGIVILLEEKMIAARGSAKVFRALSMNCRKDSQSVRAAGTDIDIMKTQIVYFSATGTTRALAEAISKGLRGDVSFTDITLPESRTDGLAIDCDLVVFATPVYGERIPAFAYYFLKCVRGNETPLAVVSVYGNMGFGITLEQFSALAKKNRFKLIAAAAFIGQHTYATTSAPVAYGRPDQHDLEQARVFGEQIQRKLDAGDFTPPNLPVTGLPKWIERFPDSGIRFLIRQPRVIRAACNACGACARRCPAGAIDLETLRIDEQKCLRCYACVKACPNGARAAGFRLPVFQSVFRRLGRKKKESRVFL